MAILKQDKRVVEEDGIVRSFFGADLVQQDAPTPAHTGKAAKARAKDFLNANSARFRLENVSLGKEETRTGSKTESVVFKQLVNDVPVYGVEFVVGMQKDEAKIASTVNQVDYKIAEQPPSTDPRITAEQSKEILKTTFSDLFGSIEFAEPELFIYRNSDKKKEANRSELDDYKNNESSDEKVPVVPEHLKKRETVLNAVKARVSGRDELSHLVWVTSIVSQKPFGKWEFFIDALNGTILWVNDMLRYVDYFKLKGNVFWPDPITSSGNGALSNTSTQAMFDAELKEVELENLLKADANGEFSLNGRWVRTKEIEDPAFAPVKSAGDFKFKYRQRQFLSVMAYYWTDRAIEYVRSFKLPTLNMGIEQYPINVDAQGADGDDNSYFFTDTSGKPCLVFGEGGVADASDAHVIVHELGHAIHWYIGSNQNERGNEEGFGDFLAGAWLDRFNTHQFRRKEVFPWDNVNQLYSADRDFGTRRKFNDQNFFRYEIHVKGSVLAAALWDIFLSLGGDGNDAQRKQAADKVIHMYMEMLTSMASEASVDELADGLLVADEALNDGVNKLSIQTAFGKRGITIGATANV